MPFPLSKLYQNLWLKSIRNFINYNCFFYKKQPFLINTIKQFIAKGYKNITKNKISLDIKSKSTYYFVI